MLILLALSFIIYFSNAYYFKNAILLESELIFIMMPLLTGLSLISIGFIEDSIFLTVMESLELLEKSPTDPEVRKQAAKKLENATNELERSLGTKKGREGPIWHSKVNELEKEFIRKLKYRAIPALREGRLAVIRTGNLSIHELEHIALVFIESGTGQMEIVNEMLENYDEIITVGKYENFLMSFYRSRIFNPSISIISGFTGLLILIFIYSLLTKQIFYDLIYDPTLVISGSLTASMLVYTFLRNGTLGH